MKSKELREQEGEEWRGWKWVREKIVEGYRGIERERERERDVNCGRQKKKVKFKCFMIIAPFSLYGIGLRGRESAPIGLHTFILSPKLEHRCQTCLNF